MPGRSDAYFDAAAALRPLLERDRRLHLDRALREPVAAGQDAVALVLARRGGRARVAQRRAAPQDAGAGRAAIFADYRLRVAQVLRDYGMNDRDEAPDDSRRVHDA